MKPLTPETRLQTALEAGDTDEIDRLAALIDTTENELRKLPVSLVSAALWYVSVGLHVFPIQAGAKLPYGGTQGFKDATTDPDRIAAWWKRRPDANIGIATGHLVDVIDIDGPVGQVSRARHKLDSFPILGRVSTPRPGGVHLYVPAIVGKTNKAGMLPGIDYRGKGGYVVAPPSRNSQGNYLWTVPLDMNRPA